MADQSGCVIYIGKATQLRRRVNSYFSKEPNDIKTKVLVSQVSKIDYIITHSESEALLLERQLIKQFQPKYNLLLKDDKNFPYIKITKEQFPKVIVVRNKKKDGARYYGPYPSIGSTRRLQRLLSDLSLLRECKQKITMEEMQPKCILLDIGKCLGPCIKKTVIKSYHAQVEWLHLLLTGQRRSIQRLLKEKMKNYAAELKFEDAAKYRDYLYKIEHLTERQSVSINEKHPIQVWVTAENKNQYYILVQEIIEGQLIRQQGYQFNKGAPISGATVVEHAILSDVENQYQVPKEILIEDALEADITLLFNTHFPHIKIRTPKRGVKRSILDRAKLNATMALKHLNVNEIEKTPQHHVLERLQIALRLSRLPIVVWGFDISHFYGADIVASSVCFDQEKPNKSGYRRFNIKTVSGKSDDYRSMKEVVSRRFQLAFECRETLPDLVLIDGGKGQLNFACQALTELGITQIIDIVALAKREESIFKPGQYDPIQLPHSDLGLQLLQRVRDEAHRFAVAHHRQKRKKRGLK